MTTREICAYLLPENAEAFWRWSDDFDAVTWWTGESIAFYQEIDAIVRRLKENGLPPFNELILILAACRKNWDEPGGGKLLFASYLQTLDRNPLPGSDRNVIADWVRPLLAGLDRVHRGFLENPALERKLTILELLFEGNSLHLSPGKAGLVGQALERGEVATFMRSGIQVDPFLEIDLFAQRAPVSGVLLPVTTQGFERAIRGEPLCSLFAGGSRTTILAEVSGEVEQYIEGNSKGCNAGDVIATIRIERSPSPAFIQAIQNVLEFLPRLESIESLESREETGLDAPPEAADEIELPESIAVRNLIRDLANDEEDELSGIARVARDLMGVLNVPRDVSDPDDMPLGGFSDIANKGDLDRLLLSELAQDDEVLAVRVALNEALYLRRESPPQDPPRQRRIFIDTGIRMWGVPRAFAHSAALALTATMETRDEARVFSPDCDFSEPENAVLLPAGLRTRDGLMESLTRLSPNPQPGPHVAEFIEEARVVADCDAIVITHPRALEDPHFRKELREATHEETALLLLTIDERGELVVICRTASGERELRRLKLDPESIHQAPKPKAKPKLTTKHRHGVPVDETLPLFLQLENIPLRIAHPCHQRNSWVSPNQDIVTLTRNGLLLCFPEERIGAVQLSDSLQTKGRCLLGEYIDGGTELLLVFGQSPSPRVFRIGLEDRNINSFPVKLEAPAEFAVLVDGHIVFFSKKQVTAVSIEEGSSTKETLLDQKVTDARERFVFFGGDWHVVSVGTEIGFTAIRVAWKNIQLPFDCPHYPEPLLLMTDTSVLRFEGEKYPAIPFTEVEGQRLMGVKNVSIRDGGNRIVFRTHGQGSEWTTLDFETQERKQHPFDRDDLIAQHEVWTPTLRKRFGSVVVTGSSVGLVKNGVRFKIAASGKDHLKLMQRSQAEGMSVGFEPFPSPASGFSLQCAELPDGSRIFLDSRGFLHLQSVDRRLAELTLVLKEDGMLSGWTSEGEFFGQDYFLAGQASVSVERIETLLTQFVRQMNQGSD